LSLTLSNAGGYWGNNTGDAMYDSYTYPNNGQGDGVGNLVATISNLPAGFYDFYLYGHADPGGCPESDTVFTLTANGASFGPAGTFASASWTVAQGWQERYQYILFRNVAVTAGSSATITGVAGYNGQPLTEYCRKAILNGIQVLAR